MKDDINSVHFCICFYLRLHPENSYFVLISNCMIDYNECKNYKLIQINLITNVLSCDFAWEKSCWTKTRRWRQLLKTHRWRNERCSHQYQPKNHDLAPTTNITWSFVIIITQHETHHHQEEHRHDVPHNKEAACYFFQRQFTLNDAE